MRNLHVGNRTELLGHIKTKMCRVLSSNNSFLGSVDSIELKIERRATEDPKPHHEMGCVINNNESVSLKLMAMIPAS